MGQKKIGAKIVLEGEAEYRNALKNINAAQKENRSEMKLWSAEFKENQNCTEALTQKHEILTKQLETQKQKIEAHEAVLTKNINAEEKAAQKVSELQTAYGKAVVEMEKMKDSSDTTTEILEAQEKKVDELKSKLELAESGYDATTRKVTQYKTALNYAEAEQRALESELSSTANYLREAKTATDGNATSIDKYGKEVQEAANEISVFGDVLKANLLSDAITTGIKRLADGTKQAAEAAVETGISFEASMSQVAATMGMTAEEVESGSEAYTLLADSAKKCGAETIFSATESGEALNYLALAGYDAKKSAATLPKVLDLAAAGNLDLAYASDLVTDSMAAMSMETDELDKYIDQMARTSQKSNTSVAQLGEATLVCAGTVSLAGQSLETMNTELGVLANNGIKGAEGGTHLRNIILSLSAPTDTASDAIKSLGLQIADSQGNMRDLNDIMIDLNSALSGMSTTEKTQMISKIFNKTDIAAVNALLKGTGSEYNNLNKEIKNCSGAAADMAKTLNNNLKGRVDELESGLEGLGIAAYEIFDEDMKKAVEAATGAVGRLQKSIDSGDLGVSLNKMADSLGEFAEDAIEVGEDALPILIDGFTWLLDNSDLVIAGITGIAAANLEMNVVAPAVETLTAAWGAYKKSTEGATVAQWLLTEAMNANPIGLFITGVTAATAAIGAYILVTDQEEKMMKKWDEETRNLIESSKELEENIAATSQAREDERVSMESQAGVCRDLVKELKELQSKTKLTKEEQQRQKAIIDQLNTAMPDLNLYIDEQSGALSKTNEELEKSVDAYYEYYKAQAAREHIKEIAEEQFEVEAKLYELEQQKIEIKEKIADAEERVQALQELSLEKDVAEGENLHDLTEMLNTYNSELQACDENIGLHTVTLEELGVEYQNVSEIMADTEGIETATGATQTLGESAATTGGQITGMSQEVQQAYQKMADDLNETITGQMNLFSEFDAKAELSTQQLLANMESQVVGISQWSDNIKELADRGIDQGLLQKLANMGPEGAGYVATFVSMTDEELQKANDLYKEAFTLPEEATSEIMESYMEAGNMAGEGFKTGVHDKYAEIDEAARQLGSGSLRTLRKELRVESPSKETKEIGEYFDEGLQGGIDGGKQAVLDTISSLCAAMLNTTKNGLQTKSFETIGKQIPEGLVSGIKSGKSDVLDAIDELCTEAMTRAKSGLNLSSLTQSSAYSSQAAINSTSREMVNISSVVEYSLPETVMGQNNNSQNATGVSASDTGKTINIPQNIHIYAVQDNIIETAAKFRQAQREAAEEW